MIEVSISQAKTNLSEYLNRAVYGRERVVITNRGKPKAVLISLEELERLEKQTAAGRRARNQRLLELLQAAPDDDKDAEWWDGFERELAQNRLMFRELE